MSDEEQTKLISAEVLATINVRAPGRYDDTLAERGRVADTYAQSDTFADYHQELTANTRAAQRDTLHLFSLYLELAGIERSIDDLYHDADAWRGMSKGLLLGFRKWVLEQGYAIGTLNQRLAILRQYCTLAHDAGVIPDETYDLLLTVKGYSQKTGRNLDNERKNRGITTRRSTKKATPTPIKTSQALRLKNQTTTIKRRRRSEQDQAIEQRDRLLMGLFIEQAFRVSEVVGLDLENFDLEAGIVTVYREKTDDTQVHRLKTHTRLAAEDYLAQIRGQGRGSGPLFVGYRGNRITATDSMIGSTCWGNNRASIIFRPTTSGIFGPTMPSATGHLWIGSNQEATGSRRPWCSNMPNAPGSPTRGSRSLSRRKRCSKPASLSRG